MTLPSARVVLGRDPFEVFMMGFGIATGTPLILGDVEPGTLSALLDPVLLRVWAWELTLSCALALVGILWPGRRGFGLLVEQLGLSLAGTGVGIYVFSLLAVPRASHVNVGLALMISLAFGVTCFVRVWQIQRWVRVASQVMRKIDRGAD